MALLLLTKAALHYGRFVAKRAWAESMSNPDPSRDTPVQGRGARRLKSGERERQIQQEAAKLFAERGFEAGTSELAERLGIAQPLLYRYFRNKDDLIQKVYSKAYATEPIWNSWEKIIDDDSRPFRDRLIDFYVSYSEITWSYKFTRMALWANLSRPDLNSAYYIGVRTRIFPRIIREMRIHLGIGRKGLRPTKLEFELVHSLHGMLYHLAIRRWVHTKPFRDNVRALIELKVDLFLYGAREIIAPKPHGGAQRSPLRAERFRTAATPASRRYDCPVG
jgi:AcrR family transcriptional regulator